MLQVVSELLPCQKDQDTKDEKAYSSSCTREEYLLTGYERPTSASPPGITYSLVFG